LGKNSEGRRKDLIRQQHLINKLAVINGDGLVFSGAGNVIDPPHYARAFLFMSLVIKLEKTTRHTCREAERWR
jgi:hypothetical protein